MKLKPDSTPHSRSVGRIISGIAAALWVEWTVVDPIALQARNVVRHSVEK